MKLKKLTVVFMTLVMVCSMLCACGSEPTKAPAGDSESTGAEVNGYYYATSDRPSDLAESETVAYKLTQAFLAAAADGNDVEKIANAIGDNKVIDFAPVVVEVNPGYLNGFSKDIDAFTKGYNVGPMIGTIPFTAYVFETDDVEALKTQIIDNKDLGWNICTMADEMRVAESGNIVFVIMSYWN